MTLFGLLWVILSQELWLEVGHRIFRKKYPAFTDDAIFSTAVTARQIATRWRLIFRLAAVHRARVFHAQLLLLIQGEEDESL